MERHRPVEHLMVKAGSTSKICRNWIASILKSELALRAIMATWMPLGHQRGRFCLRENLSVPKNSTTVTCLSTEAKWLIPASSQDKRKLKVKLLTTPTVWKTTSKSSQTMWKSSSYQKGSVLISVTKNGSKLKRKSKSRLNMTSNSGKWTSSSESWHPRTRLIREQLDLGAHLLTRPVKATWTKRIWIKWTTSIKSTTPMPLTIIKSTQTV